ncbi:hypothetical protein HMPREF1430_00231 [Helicobacter pylori GAM96Ai]|uniref:hypothetical protein n=1 Tax=Helicobacter pylori TaxID=210 RepID=UPI0002BA16F4|nr:hypothetical protein [Helicobacter pylori]EMH44816.1 hypothetical protein HMPREF1430_00231 [Helicobacter pylori GAM96Ai]
MKKLLGFLAASMIACAPLSAYGDNDDFDYDFSRINEIPVSKKIKPVETFMTPCRFRYCFYDHFDENSPFSDLMKERWRLNKELQLGNISEATWEERVFSKYQRSGKDFLITSIGGHWVVDNIDQSRIPYGAIMLNAIRDTQIELLMCQSAKDWCERMWNDKYVRRFKKNDVEEYNEGDWFLVANKDNGVKWQGVSDGVEYDFYKGATTITLRIKPRFNVDLSQKKPSKFQFESDWGLNEYSRI